MFKHILIFTVCLIGDLIAITHYKNQWNADTVFTSILFIVSLTNLIHHANIQSNKKR